MAMVIGEVDTNTYNVNLRSSFVSAYPAITSPVEITFEMRGNIGSLSTGSYSLDTGVWPAGSILTLTVPPISGGSGTWAGYTNPANGVLAGKGGDGVTTGCCDNYGPVNPGGSAILLRHPLVIINNGIIGGGGHGGLGITQNRSNPVQGDVGGGAGVIPGWGSAYGYGYTQGRYVSSYLQGGQSIGISAGNLGSSSATVVTQGNTLNITGTGVFYGAIS